ncbi:hypothetical protein XELAEV_18032330mg [Xenopus laevis]|uniref:Uncharacterized protein n=1 Tax=Xenopus laevis TaxID=8355 RepID=A0A974HGI3_XENLA|nr:hypothetical protein XELAEV_18032330mg [Xenopus laevis]
MCSATDTPSRTQDVHLKSSQVERTALRTRVSDSRMRLFSAEPVLREDMLAGHAEPKDTLPGTTCTQKFSLQSPQYKTSA